MLIRALVALALVGTVASGAQAQSQDMNNMSPTDTNKSTTTMTHKSMDESTSMHGKMPMHHNMRHHMMHKNGCHMMMHHGKKMRMCGMKHHAMHHTMKATMTTTK